ncbi:MAG: AraC family transcriptional regulator [Proteobacteria bacterium]|nr:AraC family transcriptional regulator [Pseudomonadota bacterium]
MTVRFIPPPEDLRRYFTTFYVTQIVVPEGETVVDALQPEWANLRFFNGACPESWIADGDPLAHAHFTATGPSSRPCHFRIGATRFWGIGLLPLGWHRYVGRPASDHANLIADGRTHPTFALFAPLSDRLFGGEPDEDAELERIVRFFRNCQPAAESDEARIMAIHAALIDPQVNSVAAMVDHTGLGQRTIERLCDRDFGFSPKLLLRRQRFMRSLAQFMLDPSLKWIGAIDSQYHDQAQFVRDFREFMGMAPREYAAMPHPVLDRFMHERVRMHGAPVQTMDSPEGAPHRTA